MIEVQSPTMNLAHRIAEGKRIRGMTMVMHQINKSLSRLLPLVIILLGIYSVRNYIQQTGETGTLSLVLLPVIGPAIAPVIKANGVFMSTLVLCAIVFNGLNTYIFAYRLTRRHLAAFVSALLTFLPINPYSAIPTERIRLGLVDLDGAHVIGMSLLPITLWFFLDYLKTGVRKAQIIFVGLGILLGLVSFFTALVLIVMAGILFISEMLISDGRVKVRRFLPSVVMVVMGIGLIYNISLFKIIISYQGRIAASVLVNLIPLLFFLVPVVGTIFFLIFDRRPNLQSFFIAGVTTLIFGVLQYIRTNLINIEFIDLSRFIIELSFGFNLFMGIGLTALFDLTRSGQLLKRMPQLLPYRTRIAFLSTFFIIGSLVLSLALLPRSL